MNIYLMIDGLVLEDNFNVLVKLVIKGLIIFRLLLLLLHLLITLLQQLIDFAFFVLNFTLQLR
jgi:hypothetical protein